MSPTEAGAAGAVERHAADDLARFATGVLEALGMPPADARTTAEVMRWNELRGAAGHGLSRLFQIRDRAAGGGLRLAVDWSPVSETATTTLLDAHDGWGALAGARGMHVAIEKARAMGLAVTSVRNCDVTSAMGYYPALAVEAGLVGLAVTNSVALMSPWGSSQKLLGNQAFAIGAPTLRRPPLILDSSTSALNMGSLRAAAERGSPLPPGSALDADGRETADAAAAVEALNLLPMGGHRGGGLAIMWEILTGVLAGGRMTSEVVGMDRLSESMGLSLFLLAIEPGAFLPRSDFRARVDTFVEQVLTTPPAPGVDRVRVPGMAKAEIEEAQRRDGVPVPAAMVARLRELGASVGVAWPT